MATEAADLRRGNAIRIDGEVFIVVDFQHVRPGKGPAYLQGRLRSARTGAMREQRFRINESVDPVFTERRSVTFSYRAGDEIVFLDDETFDEHRLPESLVGPSIELFAEGEALELLVADGEVLDVAWPEYVNRRVEATIEGVKKAKVTNQVKPATLDTGVEIDVPIFIKPNEVIRVAVATGKYHERAR